MSYILDACTLINLLHIDEDEFLLKKLRKIDFCITQKVYKEVSDNAYEKVKLKPQAEREKYRKYLDEQIALFRTSQIQEDDFLITEEDMEQILGYTKRNGEFHSVRLAFSKSRMDEKKIFFVTDDQPAKHLFQPVLHLHQVGYIEDSVDLLTMFFWLNEDFRKVHYLDFLSRLRSEYARGVNELTEMLRTYYTNFPKAHLRDPQRNKLRELIDKIERQNFKGLSTLWEGISSEKKFPELAKTLDSYKFILDLESDSTDLLEKINTRLSEMKSKSIFTAIKRG
ncbi:MAG: hypothetical protein LCH81_05810 [Bacteroidetes bacterium]|nr:hypothetical protein [Bacteroidota bacterium]